MASHARSGRVLAAARHLSKVPFLALWRMPVYWSSRLPSGRLTGSGPLVDGRRDDQAPLLASSARGTVREGLSRSGRAPPGGASERRRRLDAADQQFELGDLVLECGLAGLGEGDPGAGALSGVALLDGDEPGVFQHAKVLGQVACGQPERVAQVAELHPAGLVGDGEDAQPHPLMDDVVEPVRGMAGHAARRRWARKKPMPPSSSTLPEITSCTGKPSRPWPLTEPTVAVTSTTVK